MKRLKKMRLLHMGCGESLKVRGLDGNGLSLKLVETAAEATDKADDTARKENAEKPGYQGN